MNTDSKNAETKQYTIPSVSKSVLKFNPENLSNIFKNITHKPCKSPCADYAYDVLENGKFVGELFYSKDFHEWNFIKDNYPAPRITYKVSFRVNEVMFIDLFKSVGIELTLADC